MIGVDAIPYTLSGWKGRLCSVCGLFTSGDVSFIPVGRIVRTGGMKAVRDFYRSLGERYVRARNEMIIFDALIFNTFAIMGILASWQTAEAIRSLRLYHFLIMETRC